MRTLQVNFELRDFIEGELLGKPYKMGADGPDAYDCYGVVRAVMLKEGIVLPGIARNDMPHKVLATAMLGCPERVQWVEVEKGGPGDLMVMGNVDGRDYHLAVRLKFGREHFCIHTDEKTGVTIDNIQTLGFRGYHRFRYFRHKSKM